MLVKSLVFADWLRFHNVSMASIYNNTSGRKESSHIETLLIVRLGWRFQWLREALQLPRLALLDQGKPALWFAL